MAISLRMSRSKYGRTLSSSRVVRALKIELGFYGYPVSRSQEQDSARTDAARDTDFASRDARRTEESSFREFRGGNLVCRSDGREQRARVHVRSAAIHT